MIKLLICATNGCETAFERRSPRHKYCDVCATKRKRDYNKVWYETVGAEWKRINYLEHKEVLVTPGERRHREGAGIVQCRRERLVKEAAEGGRHLAKRDAPVSYPYLTGVAKYKSNRCKRTK
jgi:hypothetical protein